MRELTPLFWQVLLSAELEPKNAQLLVEELGVTTLEPVSFLRSWPRLTDGQRRAIERTDYRALEAALQKGVSVLSRPALQQACQVDRTPVAVFSQGDVGALQMPRVAIVGTRRASTYGKAVATKFAEHLVRAGVVVVSGGATGIDAAAHEGAMSAGGQTIAVFGTGIDHCHPVAHRDLFSRIAQQGLLVSPYACGFRGRADTFVARNQLIAALAQAVLVVEAPRISGSLATARHALEMGRLVFVVPANISMESFRGSHALIRDGATLVEFPEQILEDLGIAAEPTPERVTGPLSELGAQIARILKQSPATAERIAEACNQDIVEVNAELSMLEMEGAVFRDGPAYAWKR